MDSTKDGAPESGPTATGSGPSRPRQSVRRRLLFTAVWLLVGAAAIYFLAPQAGSLVESLDVVWHANPGWLAVGIALVAARYGVSAVALSAAAAGGLPIVPTTMVQLATSFVGRLTPEGIGWLVLNQRFLERLGLARASAAAALALRMAVGGVTRVGIVLLVAVLVGGEALAALDLSLSGLGVVLAVAALALLGGVVAFGLRGRAPRVTAALRSAVGAIGVALRSPVRAAVLFGTSAATTLLYVLTLAACLAAVDVEVAFLPLFAAYLASTAVAAASPTPGNLGALELALTGGLATLSVPPGTALGAVLIYRLLTFWLPLLPGFAAFRYLHRGGYL